jgi:hypothetical protein
MGILDWFRGKRAQGSGQGQENQPVSSSAGPRTLPMDWLLGTRDYRITTPRAPTPIEAARGPRTAAPFVELKFHTGQDLVAALLSDDQELHARVKRVYSLSAEEMATLSRKIKGNADIEAEIDVVANRLYWEGRG